MDRAQAKAAFEALFEPEPLRGVDGEPVEAGKHYIRPSGDGFELALAKTVQGEIEFERVLFSRNIATLIDGAEMRKIEATALL